MMTEQETIPEEAVLDPKATTEAADDVEAAAPVVPRTERPNSLGGEGPSEAFLKQVDRLIPLVKIEVAGLNMMRALLGMMWGLGLFNLIVVIVVLSAIASTPAPEVGEYSNIWEAIYKIEGIMRTVGVVFLFFLLISYPQRICRHRMERKDQAFKTQIMICIVIVFMSIGPGYSFFEIVTYWLSFGERGEGYAFVSQSSDDGSEEVSIITLLSRYSDSVIDYNTVTSMMITAFLFVLFAGVFHMQYQTAKEVEMHLKPEIRQGNVDAAFDDFFETRTVITDYGADDDEEAGDNAVSRAFQAELSLKLKYLCLQTRHKARRRFHKSIKAYRNLTGGFPFHVQIVILVYFVLSVVLPLSLSYHPSIIPIVSIVTVGRVCSLNVTEFLAMNQSSVEELTVNGVLQNVSIFSQLVSTAEDDELGICSPGQVSPFPFRRAVAVCILAMIELYLFGITWYLGAKTRVFLTTTSYAHTRREILGFHFFRHIATVCWGFILLVGILSTSLNPETMYYLETGTVVFNATQLSINTTVVLDPLFQVGVNSGTIGYGAYLAMTVTWVFLLAFANLPADSDGFRGWFTGTKVKPGEEALTAALKREDYLILISREREVQQLLALKRREERRMKSAPPMLIKYRSALNLISSESNPENLTSGAMLYLPPLWSQIAANLLVLETEILNFHFMHLSYILAGKRIDPATKEHVSLSAEEKQSLIEDKRFTLVAHVQHAETDTHVMVFTSSDRVVVAFRGSVSKVNWQTDFDSAEVVCEYAANVEPDLTDVPPGAAIHAKKMAALTPRVHGGFVKAYESVRVELASIVKRELDLNDGNRVLFVTGHSLGGGLAILCSLDLAVQMKLPRGRISVTTWGAPKVGTYSFQRRFIRMCPCAHRFCMADDPITKLPMDTFLQSVRLNGWWHCGTEILLNEVGNMLIRPSPIERFMLRQVPLGSPQAHLRMTYATSLMLWVVRSHPEYDPDWWPGVVTLFYKNAAKRLKPVAKNLRIRLLDSLLKAGVTYTHNNRLVRDMMVDTSESREEDSGFEADITSKITDLLIAYRMDKHHDFSAILDELLDLRGKKRLFKTSELQRSTSTNGAKKAIVVVDTASADIGQGTQEPELSPSEPKASILV